jgi:hypothetical protein
MVPGESLGGRLRAHWLERDIIPPGGVSQGRLREFESRYGVRLPPDLRDYYLTVDGMGTRNRMDEDLFTFWPLDDVAPASSELGDDVMDDASSFFVFADYSICVSCFAIRLSSSGTDEPVVSIWSDIKQYVAATSFADFVERYLGSERSRLDLLFGQPCDRTDA